MTAIWLVLALIAIALAFLAGATVGALVTFRASPWLIGRLTEPERLAFARKVSAHASRKASP